MPENEAAFAARIFSIQRFTGETAANFVQKYSNLLSGFLNVNEVIGILDGNEEYKDINELLKTAIDLAGAEMDTAGEKKTEKNLASVFSRLSFADELPERGSFYQYALNPLTPCAFPFSKLAEAQEHQEGNEQLLRYFYREMDILSKTPPKDYHDFIICFDRISREYMWCFTASDYEGEDISLYDFMRVTEAIMTCLVKSENKEHPFTMVMGNFSGIQKYIFSVSSPNNSGVAKRLRARSFYVDIVNRVFSQYVADCFNVEQANILMQSGGKFYCMIPTSQDINERLDFIRNEFDQYLYDNFHGAVSVNLAWMICTNEDIKNYSEIITNLNHLLDERKTCPFESVLKDQDVWKTENFIIDNDLAGKHICSVCGMALIDNNKESCSTCETQLQIGELLPKTKYIAFFREERYLDEHDTFPIFKNYQIQLLQDVSANKISGAYLIEALNFANVHDDVKRFPFARKYMANHIPTKKNGEAKTFGEIAEESTGMSKLAVLKADVDVLGFLFAEGLRTKERHYGTISRVNTMSRMLEVFFSGYIEKILEQDNKYKDVVYSVFSGGDDLFLIGPWDVMMELAVDVQKKFKEFTAHNKNITLSAAISIYRPGEHVAFMADNSEEQLERAKKEKLLKIYPNRESRNAVCVMGDLFSWDDFEEQLNIVDKLKQMIVRKQIDVGILRRLIQYSEMYRQYLLNNDSWKLMFEPMLAYDKERNYPTTKQNQNNKGDIIAWFLNEYIASMENAEDRSKADKNLYFAKTTVKIALNKTRKERN